MLAPFELRIAVKPEHIDPLGHVNNVVYLNWVQEAAVAHWRVIASEEEQQTLLWVVLRHEIDYIHPARLGDEVTARTWVGSAKGLRFERFTEMSRLSDGVKLARARTLWCPIDAKTRRPTHVNAEIRGRFSAESSEAESRDA